MKQQPKDSSWPPLGVQDVKPEGPVTKENVKFASLKQALEKAKLK